MVSSVKGPPKPPPTTDATPAGEGAKVDTAGNEPIGDEDVDGESTRPDLQRKPLRTESQSGASTRAPTSQTPTPTQTQTKEEPPPTKERRKPTTQTKQEVRGRARTNEVARRTQLSAQVPKKGLAARDDVVRVDTREYRAAKNVDDLYRDSMDALTHTDVEKMAQSAKRGSVAFQGNQQAAYEAYRLKERVPDSPTSRLAFVNTAYTRFNYVSSRPIGSDADERDYKRATLFKNLPPPDGKPLMLSPAMRPFIEAAIDPRTKLTEAEGARLNNLYVDNGDGTRTSLNALRNRALWDAQARTQLKPGMPGVGYRATIDAGFAWQQADPAKYAFTTAASRHGYSQAEIDMAAQEGARKGAPLWGTGAGFNDAFTSKEDYEARGAYQMVAGRMMGEYTLPDYAVRDLEDARRAVRTGYGSVDQYRTNLGKSAPGTWLAETVTAANEKVGEFLQNNGLDNSIARGAREAVNEYAQVSGNLVNMGAMLAYKPYAGIVKGDFRLQSEDEDLYWNAAPRRLENAVEAANAKIPGESGTVGEVVRGITKGVAELPVYAAATVAPPILIFWNAGKYANKPFDQFATGITTDALALMTGGIGQGPLAASLTKRLEQTGLSEARSLLATKTASSVAAATVNTAVPAGQAAIKLYGPGSDKLSKAERDQLEKQLSLRMLTTNATLGFGMAMLGPSHKDADLQLQKNGTILGDIFKTERPSGSSYAGVVKTKEGRVEFMELDANQPAVKAKLQGAKNVDAGQVDLALVQSRMANRVRPEDLPGLIDQSAQFATKKLKADLEVADAAVTAPKGFFKSKSDVVDAQTYAARMEGQAALVPQAKTELTKLTQTDLEAAFGKGPHTAELARLATQDGFADFVKRNPQDARYLYELTQASVDTPNLVALAAQDGKQGVKAFQAVVDQQRKNGPLVSREGAFVVVERKPGETYGQPAMEMTLAPQNDHNGAFAFASPTKNSAGQIESKPADLVQPMRIALDRIKTPDGKPLRYDQMAVFGSHGSPYGFSGGSNKEIAAQLAAKLKDRGDIKAVLVVACDQGERRVLSGTTNAMKLQDELNRALKEQGSTRTVQIFANDRPGSTASEVKPWTGATGNEKYVDPRFLFFGRQVEKGGVTYVPAGEHQFGIGKYEKALAIGAGTLAAEGACTPAQRGGFSAGCSSFTTK